MSGKYGRPTEDAYMVGKSVKCDFKVELSIFIARALLSVAGQLYYILRRRPVRAKWAIDKV